MYICLIYLSLCLFLPIKIREKMILHKSIVIYDESMQYWPKYFLRTITPKCQFQIIASLYQKVTSVCYFKRFFCCEIIFFIKIDVDGL